MPTTAELIARRRAVEALSRDILATFGERDALVHFFARKKWTQIEGGNWRSEGGRVLSNESYQRLQQRLGGTGGGGGSQPSGGTPPAAGGSDRPPLPLPHAPGVPGSAAHAAAVYEKAVAEYDAVAAEVRKSPSPRGLALLDDHRQMVAEAGRARVAARDREWAAAGGGAGGAAGEPPPAAPPPPAVPTPAASPPGLRKGETVRTQMTRTGAVPAAPPPTPAESKHIDDARAKDTARFGARAAGILHRAANAVRWLLSKVVSPEGRLYGGALLGGIAGGVLGGPVGAMVGPFLGGGVGLGLPHAARAARAAAPKVGGAARSLLATTAGGLTAANGAAYGALGGMALAGPLGLAFGTALGGGLGFRAGRHVTNKTYAMLGGKGRATAMAVRAARAAVPPAVGVARGAPWLLGGMAASGGGALAAGTPGLVAGMVPAGYMAGQAADTAAKHAKRARTALATSEASARRAERDNDTYALSEQFAEDGLPPNAVAVLKARLRVAAQKAGVALPPIPDEVVAAALRLASEEDQVATMSEFCREFAGFRRNAYTSFAISERSNNAAGALGGAAIGGAVGGPVGAVVGGGLGYVAGRVLNRTNRKRSGAYLKAMAPKPPKPPKPPAVPKPPKASVAPMGEPSDARNRDAYDGHLKRGRNLGAYMPDVDYTRSMGR